MRILIRASCKDIKQIERKWIQGESLYYFWNKKCVYHFHITDVVVYFFQVCQPCDHLCLECTGPGNANCPVCRYYRYTSRFSTCVDTCDSYRYAYEGECLPCNDQCLGGCAGPNSSDCVNCLNFKVIIDEEIQSVSFTLMFLLASRFLGDTEY